MIFGAHVIVYSKDADADRAFLRDVLELESIDAGDGWLLFALPPAEAAVHPARESGEYALYLMCDDVDAEAQRLSRKGVSCAAAHEASWGRVTHFWLPGGSEVGLYQPRHPSLVTRTED